MDDNDIEYGVKLYRNEKKHGLTFEEFVQEMEDHKRRKPMPYCTFDPLSERFNAQRLWNCLEMSMKDVVSRSGMDMAKFSRRFCIPYRTLQAWCDGTNPCPVYIKLMILEILNPRINVFPHRTTKDTSWYSIVPSEK